VGGMWIHSLWSLVPGTPEDLAVKLTEQLFVGGSIDELRGGVMLKRRDSFTGRRDDDAWSIEPDSGFETVEVSALYVVNPKTIGVPAAGGRTLVGIASPRPAANHSFVSRLAAKFDATAVLPVLSKRNLLDLAGLTVYEVRKEEDERESSVTYLDAKQPVVLNDWADETEFDAVTLNLGGSLLTHFADGQLWLNGLAPEDVPDAVGVLGAQLWTEGMAADTAGMVRDVVY
jgi:hypothetical protein